MSKRWVPQSPLSCEAQLFAEDARGIRLSMHRGFAPHASVAPSCTARAPGISRTPDRPPSDHRHYMEEDCLFVVESRDATPMRLDQHRPPATPDTAQAVLLFEEAEATARREEQLEATEARRLAAEYSTLEETLRLVESRVELRVEACSMRAEEELVAQRRSLRTAERSRRALWEERRERELKESTIRGMEPMLQRLEEQKHRAYVACEERLAEALAAHNLVTDQQTAALLAEQQQLSTQELQAQRCAMRTELACEQQAHHDLTKLVREMRSRDQMMSSHVAEERACMQKLLLEQTEAVQRCKVEEADRHIAWQSYISQLQDELSASKSEARQANEGWVDSSSRLEVTCNELANNCEELESQLSSRCHSLEGCESAAAVEQSRLEGMLNDTNGQLAEEYTTCVALRAYAQAEVELARREAAAVLVSNERLALVIEDNSGLESALADTRTQLRHAFEESSRVEQAADRRSEVQTRWIKWMFDRNAEVDSSAAQLAATVDPMKTCKSSSVVIPAELSEFGWLNGSRCSDNTECLGTFPSSKLRTD